MKTIILITLLMAQSVLACIHANKGYQHLVTEKEKLGLIYHDGWYANLIIRTQLTSKEKLPKSIAWVIPLPSKPDKYREANNELFGKLTHLTNNEMPKVKHLTNLTFGGSDIPRLAKRKSIKIHKKVEVGDYQITPIEIVTPKSSGDELNKWLTGNGFAAVDKKNQKFYLKKGVTFLAIKLNNLQKKFSFDVKPLHIKYKADKAIFPLKFSTHSGEFDLKLFAFCPGKDKRAKIHGNLKKTGKEHYLNGKIHHSELTGSIGFVEGTLSRFEGKDFNSKENLVSNLEHDPYLTCE